MNNSFLKKASSSMGDKYASIAADGIVGNEATHMIDTGSYALNALVSGSVFGGLPSNKRLAFAGETSTGKTFFALESVYHFLNDYPDGNVVYFDTEKAVDEEMLENRGIDKERVLVSQPSTIEEFRTYAVKILDDYAAEGDDAPKLLFVLDSMGMLSSEAEVSNMSEGKNVRDMQKSQLLKAAFRVLTLRLGLLNVPMIVVGHTYAKIGSFIPGQEIGGGSALKYAADYIITLTKAKLKNSTNQTGSIISATAWKSRKVREGTKVKTHLLFEKGLDRYSGLLEMAEAAELMVKSGKSYVLATTAEKVGSTAIKNNPEKYFTQDMLERLDVWIKENFSLSGTPRSEAMLKVLEEDE